MAHRVTMRHLSGIVHYYRISGTPILVCLKNDYMNLSWLLRLLPFVGGYKQKQAARTRMETGQDAEQDAFFSGIQSAFDSAEAKYLGTQLTGAEREANAFSAQQAELAWQRSQESADIAWQREFEASNTQYQRKVADLQAAGLNPMMAVSGGSSVPGASVAASSGASSVSPAGANLGDLLNFFSRLPMLKAQVENVRADTANKVADTANKEENTRGQAIINDFNERSADLRYKAIEIANSLNESQEQRIKAELPKIREEINKLRAETSEVGSRERLNEAESLLARANVYQIAVLTQYEAAYKAAATDNQRQSALLAAANAAYQTGLINNGYIDAQVRKAFADAGISESQEVMNSISAGIRTGRLPKMDISTPGKFFESLFGGLAVVLDNFNPLANIFK